MCVVWNKKELVPGVADLHHAADWYIDTAVVYFVSGFLNIGSRRVNHNSGHQSTGSRHHQPRLTRPGHRVTMSGVAPFPRMSRHTACPGRRRRRSPHTAPTEGTRWRKTCQHHATGSFRYGSQGGIVPCHLAVQPGRCHTHENRENTASRQRPCLLARFRRHEVHSWAFEEHQPRAQ